MKSTHKITLGFMILLFIGCGEGSTIHKDPPAPTNITETPTSPVINEKEKVPPAVPSI